MKTSFAGAEPPYLQGSGLGADLGLLLLPPPSSSTLWESDSHLGSGTAANFGGGGRGEDSSSSPRISPAFKNLKTCSLSTVVPRLPRCEAQHSIFNCNDDISGGESQAGVVGTDLTEGSADEEVFPGETSAGNSSPRGENSPQ